MNLSEIPTPRTDCTFPVLYDNDKEWVLADDMRQMEREAAAWRMVAEAIHLASNLDELQAAHEAFDALKAQLNETKP